MRGTARAGGAVKILCNLPLESFEPRAAYAPHELLTYGPADRMWVDGTWFPFDLAFDPSQGSIEQLLARVPGAPPDLLLLYWPDQEPLPEGLERCPIPVVGVVSDFNLTLPALVGLWPFFDHLLVDRSGVDLFRRLGFAAVQPFVQFSHKTAWHRPWPGVPRDLDVAFAGNLNPVVQRERAPWLARLAALAERGVRVAVQSGIRGAAYGRFLSRARIGFNRSIRGEMNLRAFEVPACGALLLMERDNLEVREFFVPGEECVLYGDDDLEEVIGHLLADEPRRARIAAAGHRRVQEHRMSRRLAALLDLVRGPRSDRPPCDPAAAALGRAVAMLGTWAGGEAVIAAAHAALRHAPHDPRAGNAFALALLRADAARHATAAFAHLRDALRRAPTHLPSALNLAWLLQRGGDPCGAARLRAASLGLAAARPGWADVDGPLLPFGFTTESIARAHALRDAVLAGDPRLLLVALGAEPDLVPARG
ncbi:MAG: glycosyltransferase family 1 protein [Planctomycetes bacterium]|nr:glycosyltransferase family 1 protein [Planctomycetota bacterium]